MPRSLRITDGGIVYHVLNRANARMTLFKTRDDYASMLSVIYEVHRRVPLRIIGYCIMPNHWHLLLRPRGDGDLPEFMRLLTVTHTQRWHSAHGTAGSGHVYQGRYKSFPVQQTRPSAELRCRGVLEGGDAVLSVLRYVERNPLKAGLVGSAERWEYSSLHARLNPDADSDLPRVPLTDPSGGLPRDWLKIVNRPQTEDELQAISRCMKRGCPFGREQWTKQMAAEWGMESTLRPRGRPRTTPENPEKGS